MFNPFSRSAKVAPSHYPRVAFHGLRFLQLISSLVVGAIMAFFTYHLTHDHWSTPWTFMFLFAASLLSIAVLAFTIILHCFTGLNPRLNIALNSGLALLWLISWSMLTWYMSGTLRNACDFDHWEVNEGVMVCRIYKALFTFAFIGLLSTLAALGLDIYVRRQQTARGVYRLQEIDTKRPTAAHGPFTDPEQSYDQGGLQPHRDSEAWESNPRPSIGPYGEAGDSKQMANSGYAVPENQFDYDTGYHGGHETR
ncbi:hypothetical protein K431DRAFT_280211 [Polychaeton citri CBS 116435]|uniref:MARVEL domain-containing protein n=1 Tax=Polychaeton citri CBS 116435 TaxID=1314669 RepID=A0A9P4QJQ8_9PEZI|nr:hypothetical protein K431DRAFT_280211 [Polychaeton citri CBS 116435]